MEPVTTEDWKTLIKEYRSEIIDEIISQYEFLRNEKRPKDSLPYEVDRKRYDDTFWFEVFSEHVSLGHSIIDTIFCYRSFTGGKSPWPELLRKIRKLIDHNPHLITSGGDKTALTFDQLGDFSTQGELETNLSRMFPGQIKDLEENPESGFILQITNTDNWPWLMNERNGRRLMAHILTRICDSTSRENLESRLGKPLSGFCEGLRCRQ